MSVVKLIFVYLFLVTTCVNSNQDVSFFSKKGVLWAPEDNVFILFRHAEKETGKNPTLTKEGEIRAEKLPVIFGLTKPTKIYSTDLLRTIGTALPLSKKFEMDIDMYNPENLGTFAKQLQAESTGIVAISGHSNTTPELANELCSCNEFSEIDESDFGNLYIVVVKNGDSQTYQLRY